jgi:radical SAM superfamily enzyme YgiQ (UPF0313 family)
MEILLLNPPFLPRYSREQRSPAVTKSGTLYYPMWLSYATALLDEKGFDCVLIDAVVKSGETKLERYIRKGDPKLIVLDTSTPSISNDLIWAVHLKERFPSAFILLVGPHVSVLGEEIMSEIPYIDGVARGEYEFIVVEVAERLRDGNNNMKGIEGIICRDNGNIVNGRKRHLLRDLDKIPYVSKAYLKHLNHTDYFYSHSRYPIVITLSARGCPYGCIYCLYPQTFSGQVYRPRSIDAVVSELEFIQKGFKPLREVMFEDDSFVVDEERTFLLAEAIINSRFRLPFSCNARPDVSYKTLKVLKKAGLRLMCVGFESGNQKILNSINKKTDISTIERFVRDARRVGIMIHGCFMVGSPDDDVKMIKETYRFAERLNTDTAQFFPVMVYPGTSIYRQMKKLGYIDADNFRDWLTPDGLHNCVLSNPHLKGLELVKFCNEARKHYYLRPLYIVRKIIQSYVNSQEAIRNIKAAGNLLRHLL